MTEGPTILGSDPRLLALLETAQKVAPRRDPVLIRGETGTGKGLLAEVLHAQSGRGGELVAVNCAALPANLIESELFGYEKGAFTGADKTTPGLFEEADGGTLFLDEIGEAPASAQAKLLRALEEGVVRRVGGRKEIPVDVRVLCATNRDLRRAIEQGGFREDLFFRVATFELELPPLRDRGDDILEVAREFLKQSGDGKRFSPRAVKLLQQYPWPGNLRELKSAISYAAAISGNARDITPEHLPPAMTSPSAFSPGSEPAHVSEFRKLQESNFEDERRWAKFLLALHDELNQSVLTRKDMTTVMRAVRGPGPTENALINDWQRKLKPAAVELGLLVKDGMKHRIAVDACRAALDETVRVVEKAAPQRPSTGFVGREDELRRLERMTVFDPPSLVTVLGPGGMGKTRLVNELSRRVEIDTTFVDLSDACDAGSIAYAVARALGSTAPGSRPIEQVGLLLEERAGLLLILDNLEQAVAACEPTIGAWRRRAPGVRFLVTSRETLNLEGERVFELAPLPVPDEGGDIDTPAVALFVQTARRTAPSFRLTDDNAADVAAICREVDGLPLAIELAAARVSVLAPRQLIARLQDKLKLLRSSRRDIPERHRSITATVAWSVDLLDEAERDAFAQLAVFRGGFTLESAEAVLDVDDVMDVVQALREKSLLRSLHVEKGARLDMYVAVHEFATQLLEESGRADELRTRHLRHFIDYAENRAERVRTPEAAEALDELELERANLLAAHDYALAQADDELCARMALGLDSMLGLRGPMLEQISRLRRSIARLPDAVHARRSLLRSELARALQQAGDLQEAFESVELAFRDAQKAPPKVLGEVLLNRSVLHYRTGRFDDSLRDAEEAMQNYRKDGEQTAAGRALSRVAVTLGALGRQDEALERCQEARDMLEQTGDLYGLAHNLGVLGVLYHNAKQPRQAADAFRRAQDAFERFGDARSTMASMVNRSLQEQSLGNLERALELAIECEGRARNLGDRDILASNALHRGIVLTDLGRDDEALEAVRDAERHARSIGRPSTLAISLEYQALLLGRRGDIGGAQRRFGEIFAMKGVPRETIGSVKVSQAQMLLGDAQHQQALHTWREAVELGATDHRVHEHSRFSALALGASLHALVGDRETARELAGQAMELARAKSFTEQGPGRRIAEAMRALRPLIGNDRV